MTISSAELDRLAQLYEVTEDETARLRELGREARRRGVVPATLEYARTFLDLEQAADEVLALYGELLPGLLQIESYARVLLASGPSNLSDQRIGAIAADRAARITRFRGGGSGRLWVVLGEAVLHRSVGGTTQHRAQLQHLRKLAEESRITLQVLPFAAGEFGALGVSFSMMRMVDPAFTLVYVEALTDGLYHDTAVHTEKYGAMFTKAQVVALNERDSARMLEARLDDLG